PGDLLKIVKKGGQRNSLNRIQGGENRQQPVREKQTGHATDQRQQYVLREKLPGDAPTTRTERASQHEFSFARDSASQLQIGYVRATNQQKKYDPGNEREQRVVHSTFQIAQQILTKRDYFHRPPAAKIGILLFELVSDRL